MTENLVDGNRLRTDIQDILKACGLPPTRMDPDRPDRISEPYRVVENIIDDLIEDTLFQGEKHGNRKIMMRIAELLEVPHD